MQAARGASLTSDDDETSTPEPRERPRLTWCLVVAGIVYVIDQATKIWAVHSLADRGPVTVVPGVLDLRFLRNPGAAFGLATGMTWLLTVVAFVVVVVVLVMAARLRNRTWALALGLLLGGALGNLTDRLVRQPGFMRGHVVDFLELPNWPVFNIADTALTLACVLIVVQSLRGIGTDGSRGHRETKA